MRNTRSITMGPEPLAKQDTSKRNEHSPKTTAQRTARYEAHVRKSCGLLWGGINKG
ncbi:hypothetical protein NBRC116587_04090 [Pseudoteredinibacter isoporae]